MDVWKLRLSPSFCVCSLLQLNKLEKLSSFYCKLAGSARASSAHLSTPTCISGPSLNSVKVILETVSLTLMQTCVTRKNISFLGQINRANVVIQVHPSFPVLDMSLQLIRQKILHFFFFFEVKSLVFKLEYTVFKFSLKFVCLPPFSPPVFPLNTVLFHVK